MAEARGQRQVGRLRNFAGLLILSVLAACQVVPKAPPRQAPPPPPRAEPVGPALPSDTERHRIALLVPLTGPNAGVGTSIANAASLAVLDTGGTRIRITTYDTGLGAAAAARRALADGNRLFLGPLTADEVRAVAPVARAARVPVVAFSNDTAVAGDGVYLIGYPPAQSVQRVVEYARSKGLNKFAALVPAGLYGQRASTAFVRSVEAAGGTVVGMQTFDRSSASISSAVMRLAQTSPWDAVLIADGARIALQAVPRLRAQGGNSARILGTELWNTEAGLAANPALRGAWFASVSDALYNQLVVKYRARFGRNPYRLASLGYDGVLLVTRLADAWQPGSPFPASRLADSRGFSGIDGAFRFGRDGVAERALEVQQVGSNGPTVIATASSGF